MTFGEKIKALREENGMNCKELSEKAGVTAATIHNIENGKTQPQLVVVKKLSEALNCDFEELYKLL